MFFLNRAKPRGRLGVIPKTYEDLKIALSDRIKISQ